MANPWFRMYAEFATDPKVQMMSEANQRRFIMLLCLRCSNDDETLRDDEVAFQLRISEDEWTQTKAAFLAKGLINESNTPAAWDKRQFVSDSSAERVRKHREKKKEAVKRQRNVTETSPEAEADTETDKDIKPKAAASQVPTPQDPAEPDAALPEVSEDHNETSDNPLSGLARRAGEIVQLLRQRGAHLQPGDPRVKRWAEENRTDVQLLQALEIAQQRRESSRSTAPINAGYLDSILADVVAGPATGRPAARPQIDDWYRSDGGIDRKGRELGMYAHGGESYAAFRDRIWQRIREIENSPQEATS